MRWESGGGGCGVTPGEGWEETGKQKEERRMTTERGISCSHRCSRSSRRADDEAPARLSGRDPVITTDARRSAAAWSQAPSSGEAVRLTRMYRCVRKIGKPLKKYIWQPLSMQGNISDTLNITAINKRVLIIPGSHLSPFSHLSGF